MSKSLARVVAALQSAGIHTPPLEMSSSTRTAAEAAQAAGCALNQIAKSIIFQGDSGQLYLFLTAGGRQVDPIAAAALAGEPLGRADAQAVRNVTGFAIGGVAPLGHLTQLPLWLDETLLEFEMVWAAAGTPIHIFSIAPHRLMEITGARQAKFTL
jgi:prolyl-tRNA editing enzyme YbaK/EbsC (Cys-tRNA(Pro) deacylase)